MAGKRRTQAERRAETRGRLLDATLECLVEYGYHGTTAARIVERAGVTRGAQTHYFATVEDLIVAAVEHLARRRGEQLLARIGQVLEADDPLDALLDVLWDAHCDDLFVATVELWVAARTNAVLRVHLDDVERSAVGPLQALLRGTVDDHEVRQRVMSFAYTAMDAIRGMLIWTYQADDPAEVMAQRWDRARAELRRLGLATLRDEGIDLRELIGATRLARPD